MLRQSSIVAARFGAAAILIAGLACGPTTAEPGGTAGTSAAGTGGATGGTSPAGTAGSTATGTAGTTAGAGGNSGVAGMATGGAAGAAGDGNRGQRRSGGERAGGPRRQRGGGGTGGNASAGRGGSSAGSGGRGGSSAGGAAGAGTGGSGGSSTGTATFTVQVQLASADERDAPGTIGIVTWTVNVSSLTEAHIDFGLDTSYGMTAPVDLALTDHRTLLLGMKPAKTYHFRVVARDASATYTSNDYTVMTGPATTTVSISRFQVMNATASKRGFIITSYWPGTGSAVPFILDADGEIVWWGRGGPTGGIARARMSADGKNMWMTSASNTGHPIQRLSMDALDAQTYSSAVGSHDLTAGQRRDDGVPRVRRDRLQQHLRDRSQRDQERDLRIAGRGPDAAAVTATRSATRRRRTCTRSPTSRGRVRRQPRRCRCSGGCRRR